MHAPLLQGYYRRGDANFALGKFKEAVKDLRTVRMVAGEQLDTAEEGKGFSRAAFAGVDPGQTLKQCSQARGKALRRQCSDLNGRWEGSTELVGSMGRGMAGVCRWNHHRWHPFLDKEWQQDVQWDRPAKAEESKPRQGVHGRVVR